MATEPVTPLELVAIALSRELRDGELYIVGGASPVPLAAGLLAQATHAPNLTVLTGSGGVNPRPATLPPSGGDATLVLTAEAIISIDDIFDYTESGAIDVACFGGIEVDQYGNFNLDRTAGFHGPGLVNAGIPMTLGRFLLFVPNPSPRNMVPAVFHASGAGTRWPDGGSVIGRRGRGPELLLTPLCAFIFDGEGLAVLSRLAPGASTDQVSRSISFPLRVSPLLEPFPTAGADELDFLRSLDRYGLLSN